jgi:predicted Zn-dependent protease
MQDFPKAQSLLAEARRMDPSSAAVAIDLGKVYLAQGKAPESEAALAAALRLHPHSNALHYNLALALAQRDPQTAAEHARRATFSEDAGLRNEAERLLAELTRSKT